MSGPKPPKNPLPKSLIHPIEQSVTASEHILSQKTTKAMGFRFKNRDLIGRSSRVIANLTNLREGTSLKKCEFCVTSRYILVPEGNEFLLKLFVLTYQNFCTRKICSKATRTPLRMSGFTKFEFILGEETKPSQVNQVFEDWVHHDCEKILIRSADLPSNLGNSTATQSQTLPCFRRIVGSLQAFWRKLTFCSAQLHFQKLWLSQKDLRRVLATGRDCKKIFFSDCVFNDGKIKTGVKILGKIENIGFNNCSLDSNYEDDKNVTEMTLCIVLLIVQLYKGSKLQEVEFWDSKNKFSKDVILKTYNPMNNKKVQCSIEGGLALFSLNSTF
ncbi:unnamed protein product [Moneuplotes crassus]|uniref:Uncharacterized protein n=1 Tax=Euplotes crassus TaxID=5936 RepID=A0AAD1X7G4_EUPCR|nr:unnamed protein product [Moneuplotes crassus]